MNRNSGVVFAVCFLWLATAMPAAADLFELLAANAPNKASASAEAAYQSLLEKPLAAELRLVTVNPGVLSLKRRQITLELAADLKVKARRVDSYRVASGSLIWSGVIVTSKNGREELDPTATVMLVERRGSIAGLVQMAGRSFAIRPLAGGTHAIAELDPSRFPADDPADFARVPVIPMLAVDPGVNARTNTVITLQVNYTAAAAAAAGDIELLIDLSVANTNQTYANSGVLISLELSKSAQTTYSESGSSVTDLQRYRVTNDGFMDFIHTQRTQHGADVAVLLTAYLESGIAGRAAGIGSNAATAFAVVDQFYAAGNLTLAHEIGHLQSARHDHVADPTNTPYAYGHGYFVTSAGWRTVMGTISSCPSCERIFYWSNPTKIYNGVAMGTTNRNDNTRVLNNTRATVAGFKTKPGCVPDGDLDDTLGMTSCCSNAAVNGSTYCTNPADWNNGWASCTHICRSALVGGCIPSGGIDDIWSSTSCCSGASVPGSAYCNDPADYGDDWTTCSQICL